MHEVRDRPGMGVGNGFAAEPFDELAAWAIGNERTRDRHLGRAAEEVAYSHGQGVTTPFAQERAEKVCVDVPLHDWPAREGHLGCRHRAAQEGNRIAEGVSVKRTVFAERERKRGGLATAPCPADTLAIVRDRRRHVGHHHRFDRADVDAHLHRCRTVQNVDLAFPEGALVAAQRAAVLLRRVLRRAGIVCE